MEQQGLALLLEEFEKPLSELKSAKAQGIDGIPAELLKALRYATTYMLVKNGHEISYNHSLFQLRRRIVHRYVWISNN